MRKSTPLTITLPPQMAKKVKARVKSGSYASESEVIRDGLRALDAEEKAYAAALEEWLQTEGRKAVEDYEAGRMTFAPAKEVFARVRERIAKRRPQRSAKR